MEIESASGTVEVGEREIFWTCRKAGGRKRRGKQKCIPSPIAVRFQTQSARPSCQAVFVCCLLCICGAASPGCVCASCTVLLDSALIFTLHRSYSMTLSGSHRITDRAHALQMRLTLRVYAQAGRREQKHGCVPKNRVLGKKLRAAKKLRAPTISDSTE